MMTLLQKRLNVFSLEVRICLFFLVLSYCCLFLELVEAEGKDPPPSTTKGARSRPSRGKIISLAESIKLTMKTFEDPDEAKRIRRQYWIKTLADIEKLSLSVGIGKDDSFFGQYKPFESSSEQTANLTALRSKPTALGETTGDDQLSNTTMTAIASKNTKRSGRSLVTRPRFEGFRSWERLLQEWSEEVQEYMQKVERESGSEYTLANYGRPSSLTKENATMQSTRPEVIDSKLSQVEMYVSDEDENGEASVDLLDSAIGAKPRRERLRVIPKARVQGEPVLPHTDLSDKSKKIEIVTTASLPWKTGTAVNPLLRAAYMLEGRIEAGGSVTIMLPWLERPADQERVYGKACFETEKDQEKYIRAWLKDSANMPEAARDLMIRWYTAWQSPIENSIYSMGDITALIPAEEVDVIILEEPEHLNWYRAPGESWTTKFKHVVGILHTNYFQYALDQPAALVRAPAMRLLCSWMCRAHCHRVIKLSGTIDKVAPDKELIENVHGVRGTFLDIGAKVKQERLIAETTDNVFGKDAEPTIYFIGKMLWSKGLDSLMELLHYAEESAGIRVKVDMYGAGPDKDDADKKAASLGLDMPFHGPLDHAELGFSHKIFLNPSTSEVLCTTSAEALAMGKFLILPRVISNDFFIQFPNCLSYASKEEFVGNLFYAMTHSPEPLSDTHMFALSWRAATNRLEAAGCIPVAEAEQLQQLELSSEGGVEIPLPPLIEDEKRRKQISTTLQNTKERYQQFRSRLSSEILQNKVLPMKLRERIAADFEKELDLDIEEILESPKLRLKLSPAELDKKLLELYNGVSAGPGGDLLRIIGGGGEVALQNRYVRRQALKQRRPTNKLDLFPFGGSVMYDLDDTSTTESDRSASQWIRWALKRNLPKNVGVGFYQSKRDSQTETRISKTADAEANHINKKTPRMSTFSCSPRPHCNPKITTWSGLARSRQCSFSLLI